MNSDLETAKLDYVIKNVCKQVYNVFPFVGIKCEPSWDDSTHDIIARWYHKGNGHVFKYTITDELLYNIVKDLDYIVLSLTHQICNKIIESCNDTDEEEDN